LKRRCRRRLEIQQQIRHALAPLHGVVFDGMLRGIKADAEARTALQATER
jgi:heat shock protein HspQ